MGPEPNADADRSRAVMAQPYAGPDSMATLKSERADKLVEAASFHPNASTSASSNAPTKSAPGAHYSSPHSPAASQETPMCR